MLSAAAAPLVAALGVLLLEPSLGGGFLIVAILSSATILEVVVMMNRKEADRGTRYLLTVCLVGAIFFTLAGGMAWADSLSYRWLALLNFAIAALLVVTGVISRVRASPR